MMILIRILVLFYCFLVTHLTRAIRQITISCVGDSITFGYGCSDQGKTSYPAILRKLFSGLNGIQVFNFGVPGATMMKKGTNVHFN